MGVGVGMENPSPVQIFIISSLSNQLFSVILLCGLLNELEGVGNCVWLW